MSSALTLPTVAVVRFTIAGVPVEKASAGLGRPYTVVYDGSCRVCQGIVRTLTRWDTHRLIELSPSQGPGVRARFPWIPERAYAESVQLIAADGHTWQGAEAVEHIIDLMPKGWLISWVFSIPFVRPLAERFYRWFARHRYQLGCGKHCQYRQLALDFEGAEPKALPAPPPAGTKLILGARQKRGGAFGGSTPVGRRRWRGGEWTVTLGTCARASICFTLELCRCPARFVCSPSPFTRSRGRPNWPIRGRGACCRRPGSLVTWPSV